MPIASVVIAYLLGSIPFGFLIVRAIQGADIRDTGSGGTGATNVSRRAGKIAGIVTLLLDALKGAAAVVIAEQLNGIALGKANWWVAGAAVAVIMGHMFPVWLRFRGGKGVATMVGVFLVLAPVAVGLAGVVLLLVVVSSRYVSLGSLIAAVLIPILIWVQSFFFFRLDFFPLLTTAAAVALLVIFAHRANIRRLIEGSENKFE